MQINSSSLKSGPETRFKLYIKKSELCFVFVSYLCSNIIVRGFFHECINFVFTFTEFI